MEANDTGMITNKLPRLGCLKGIKTSPVFTLEGRRNTFGLGRIVDGKFVVLAGSRANPCVYPSVYPSAVKDRHELIRKGFVKNWVVIKDITFNSCSGAACALSGAQVNGKVEWKNGKTTLYSYVKNAKAA